MHAEPQPVGSGVLGSERGPHAEPVRESVRGPQRAPEPEPGCIPGPLAQRQLIGGA